MSYDPTTDFLALLRATSGGQRFARGPTRDIVLYALSQAGLFNMAVSQTAPTVNQATTAWLLPAAQSWSQEGTLYLWNAAAAEYQPATPVLFKALIMAAV